MIETLTGTTQLEIIFGPELVWIFNLRLSPVSSN